MNDEMKSLEEFVNPEEFNKSERKTAKWPSFIETDVLNFFNTHEIEKISLEDGNGNKAKLSRTKDHGIKVEYSSTTLL